MKQVQYDNLHQLPFKSSNIATTFSYSYDSIVTPNQSTDKEQLIQTSTLSQSKNENLKENHISSSVDHKNKSTNQNMQMSNNEGQKALNKIESHYKPIISKRNPLKESILDNDTPLSQSEPDSDQPKIQKTGKLQATTGKTQAQTGKPPSQTRQGLFHYDELEGTSCLCFGFKIKLPEN